MNNFETLDAQSEVCALATIAPNEVYTQDVAPVVTVAPRGPNARKIAYFNIGKPLNARLSHATLAARGKFARHRGNMVAIHARISAELEPARQAIVTAYDAFKAGALIR